MSSIPLPIPLGSVPPVVPPVVVPVELEHEEEGCVCSHCEEEFTPDKVQPCHGTCGKSFCTSCSLVSYPHNSHLPRHMCFDCHDTTKRAAFEELERVEPPSDEEQASTLEWGRIVQGLTLPSPAIVAIANLSGFLTLLQENGGGVPPQVEMVEEEGGGGMVEGKKEGGEGMKEEEEEEEEEGMEKEGPGEESGPSTITATSLPHLLTLTGKQQTLFKASALYHALRLLGEAHATPPPVGDPSRTYLTLFSQIWYPRLHSIRLNELRRVQTAAAYLNIAIAASDAIVGAVACQKFANVPTAKLHKALSSGYPPSSLYTAAIKYFNKHAMAPFERTVLPRLLAASNWGTGGDGGGWTGKSFGGTPPGFLCYRFDVFVEVFQRNAFGLGHDLDREWDGDTWEKREFLEELDDCRGDDEEASMEELLEYEAEKTKELKALRVKEKGKETLEGRECIECLEGDLENVKSRMAKLERDGALAAAAALPVPMAQAGEDEEQEEGGGIQSPEHLLLLCEDASAPYFNAQTLSNDEHSPYLATALLHRLRGLPVGRRWRAMEKLGAPLASLSGFRGPGEPGSAQALKQYSTPMIVAELFAASGSVSALEWLFESRLFCQGEGGYGVSVARRFTWSLFPHGLPNLDYLRFMLIAAMEEGHGKAVEYLQMLHPSSHFLPLEGISAALQRGHTELVEGALRADLEGGVGTSGVGEGIGQGEGGVVLGRWGKLLTACLGEVSVVQSQSRHDRFTPGEFMAMGDGYPGFSGTSKSLSAIDAKLVRFALAHRIPLLPEAVRRLAAAGSTVALRALPFSLLAEACKWGAPGLEALSEAVVSGGVVVELSLGHDMSEMDMSGGGEVEECLRAYTVPPFKLHLTFATLRACVYRLGSWGRGSVWDYEGVPPHEYALCMLRALLSEEDLPLHQPRAAGGGEEGEEGEEETDDEVEEKALCAHASISSLEALQLLRDRGVAWDHRVYLSRCAGVVEWAAAQGCPRLTAPPTPESDQRLFIEALEVYCSSQKTSAGRSTSPASTCIKTLLAAGCTSIHPDALEYCLSRVCTGPKDERCEESIVGVLLAFVNAEVAKAAHASMMRGQVLTPTPITLLAFTASAKVAFPLKRIHQPTLLLTLAEAGWPWCPTSAIFLLTKCGTPTLEVLKKALSQGCPLTLPEVLASAFGRGRHREGHTILARTVEAVMGAAREVPRDNLGWASVASPLLLPPLPSLAASFPWHTSCVNPHNLLMWQYASEKGCPWAVSACRRFEATVEETRLTPNSDTPTHPEMLQRYKKRELGMLEAAEIHRYWLGARRGGCPCGGRLHASEGIFAPVVEVAEKEEGGEVKRLGGKRKRVEGGGEEGEGEGEEGEGEGDGEGEREGEKGRVSSSSSSSYSASSSPPSQRPLNPKMSFRSLRQLAGLYARGEGVVGPYLNLWMVPKPKTYSEEDELE